MDAPTQTWPPDAICLRPEFPDVTTIAAELYARTCRVDFATPGFCLINFGDEYDSVAFRQKMVDLKQAMARLHEAHSGKTLAFLSAARFDQQETTRPHLDSGPDECFLMLGYEPSDVNARLTFIDYSKCASDHGLTPKELLDKHNPMFKSADELFKPYSTRLPCFSRNAYQVVCINNSSAAINKDEPRWQGVLHTAEILTPDDSKRRVINSTMIASVPMGTPDQVTISQQHEFVHTTVVRRRGYDKPHLEDDV